MAGGFCYIVRVDDQYDCSVFGVYSTLDAAKAYVEGECAGNSNCAGKDWRWLEEDNGDKLIYCDEEGNTFHHGRIDRYPLDKPAF